LQDEGSSVGLRQGDARGYLGTVGAALLLTGYWQGSKDDLKRLLAGVRVKAEFGRTPTTLEITQSNPKSWILTERRDGTGDDGVLCEYEINDLGFVKGQPVKNVKRIVGGSRKKSIESFTYTGSEEMNDVFSWVAVGSRYRDFRYGPERVVEATWTGDPEQAPPPPDTSLLPLGQVQNRGPNS
jgi:hypothetical protein